MNVLIVDDDIIVIEAMKQSIDWGLLGVKNVFIATQISKAKNICDNNKVHIILCDIEMPGGSGIELLYWIREKYPHMECAFLTCHADFLLAQEALKLRSFDYLVKPIPFDQIAELVKRMITKIEEQNNEAQKIFYGTQWLKEKADKLELQSNVKRNNEEIVDEVVGYIIDNISTDLTVEKLAQKAFLHPDYLNRIFKKIKEYSLNQFIIKERMNLAARMISEYNISINLVALEVGYDNYSNFVNMFKKIHGCTPSEYKLRYFKDNPY